MSELIESLARKPGPRLVILIDEYDRPIVHNPDRPELMPGILKIMQDFYGILKARSSDIHLTFMTGITRISRVGLFAGANHFTDLSFERPCSTLLGYTQTELEQHRDIRAAVAASAGLYTG